MRDTVKRFREIKENTIGLFVIIHVEMQVICKIKKLWIAGKTFSEPMLIFKKEIIGLEVIVDMWSDDVFH